MCCKTTTPYLKNQACVNLQHTRNLLHNVLAINLPTRCGVIKHVHFLPCTTSKSLAFSFFGTLTFSVVQGQKISKKKLAIDMFFATITAIV